ncbi:permease prefix domain 1-containing protein [Micromonospora sp. NBC_01796]|uniref:permease prefix domain 1-containing protein n=1 Tax=Micromonospora sp. NBC_01796 TaxID=2975987 RepID=UPI002DDB23F6|nr:permease prefix domain 1-containing protein [Micromonospora sp. NBC_01796]WSA85636.1 permease prefix domain 1-containing protein [Micromonospora sp. NBC_01796]
MIAESDNDLEGQIAQWRAYMQRRRELHRTDAEELEDHLRSRVTELTEAGLHTDEAFLIAVKRMGSLDELSREFAREHSERLWKQLVLPGEPDAPAAARTRRELPVMVLCAAVAALAIKVPALFGLDISDDDGPFFVRNFSLFALPALAAYFVWQRRVAPRTVGVLALLFVLGGVAVNAYPMADDSQSLVLTAIHLPLALWLVVGVAYVGGDWRSDRRRMDFIRFTGEWLIYLALIGLGGGVLTAFTAGTFRAIGLNAEGFIEGWLLPCGAMAAIIVAAWLVEAKQSVIENMAPVLTRVFTPLFAATLLAFLVAIVWTTNGIDVERDALILFDLLLVVVLGLLLYAISARDLTARPGLFDRLQLALVVSALVIDVLVLVAITGRITEWGFSPNKTAALGENLILLTNLAWSAWLFLGFVRGRMPFARLERWQTRYVLVYAVWAWAVILVFPLVFNFD